MIPPTCGECLGLVIEGHRVVNLPCGHVLHAPCVLSNFEGGGERALLGMQSERMWGPIPSEKNLWQLRFKLTRAYGTGPIE